MIEVKKFLEIFVIVNCITAVLNIELESSYKNRKFYTTSTGAADKYCCFISDGSITKVEDKDILTVNGAHESGKNNNDVEAVIFNKIQNTSYLAIFSKIQEVFPSLRYLEFYNTNMNGITNEDMKYLSNLQSVEILNCTISSIPSSLFQFNRYLKSIVIEDNSELDHIGKDIFNNLPYLQSVRFKANKCLNEEILCEGRNQIDKLSSRIFSSSCFLVHLFNLVEQHEKNLTEKVKIQEYVNNDLRKNIDQIVKNQENFQSNMNETTKTLNLFSEKLYENSTMFILIICVTLNALMLITITYFIVESLKKKSTSQIALNVIEPEIINL